MKPLTDLTSKKVPNILPWEECHQQAYELLRSKLRSSHVLRIPRVGDPFVLHTDASGVAVGATLGQLDKDGVEHPLAFASHKLSGSQCSWSTIEREAYAIIWALDKFRDTVYGSKITVVCDHNLLQYIRDCAPKSAKCYFGHLHSKNLTSKLSTNEVLIMWWRITYHVMCSVSLTMICTFCVYIYMYVYGL